MSESQLVRRILRYIETRRIDGCPIKARKNHGSRFSDAGDPDLTICYRGFLLMLEVKIGNNKPTKIQLERLRQWKDAGAIAEVVRNVEEVERLLLLTWSKKC